jgi:hypothetical protein
MALEIFQGEDKALTISSDIDLTSHTEIEFGIDFPNGVVIKTLSSGKISNVTPDNYVVQMDASDTDTVEAGTYKYQVRVTDSTGLKNIGKFQPNKLRLKESIFLPVGSGKDYN